MNIFSYFHWWARVLPIFALKLRLEQIQMNRLESKKYNLLRFG